MPSGRPKSSFLTPNSSLFLMTSPGSVRNARQLPLPGALIPKYEGLQTPITFPASLTPVAMQCADVLALSGPRFMTVYLLGDGAGAHGLGLGDGVGVGNRI